MRRVLITGANRGIGLALTRAALDRGAIVFGTCRSPDDAPALHLLRDGYPETLHILPLELLDPETHQAARREIEQQTGALDVLINNAGINYRHVSVAPEAQHRSVEQLDERSMMQMLRVNTVSPLLLTRELLALLRKGSEPQVAFVSSGMGSIAGKDGREIEYSYSASKAALNMLTRVLAHELRDDGISVLALNPGWVATRMATPGAPLKPDEVAPRLWQVLEAASLEVSGSFLDWQGRPVLW